MRRRNASAVMAVELPPTITVGLGIVPAACAVSSRVPVFRARSIWHRRELDGWQAPLQSQRAYLVFEAVYSAPKVPDPVADVVDPVADLVRADPHAPGADKHRRRRC